MANPDVVIVGAGSAGCALANRLTSDPTCNVLLLEAGGSDERDAIRIPREYFSLWDTDVDWQYVSTPQPGTANRTHKMPRGKVLGGTSSLNGMVYLRGAKSDYDGWAALGCRGWDWKSLVPEFEGLEAWLKPAVLDPLNELSQAMVEAAVQCGFPRSSTFDAGSLDGAGWNKSCIMNGERNNTHRAFILPIRDRKNLAIRTHARVARLAMDGTRAQGVMLDGGERIEAGKVVLCSGTFDSPRILMSSGIGPATHLSGLGVSPRADLPVGENLVDHLLIGIVYNAKREISELNALCTEGCAFARSSPDRHDCDIEISFATKPHFAPETDDGAPRFTIIPGITKPKSRGTLRLTSADPRGPLAIDPNYFHHPDDMRTMIHAVRLSREIGRQRALADWTTGEWWPGTDIDSDDAIAKYVQGGVSTWFHPVGTCRMGVGPDSVVDAGLRVHGVENLRVADASIMPEIVGVNTHGASVMIGWKAGSLMLSG
jgi:choline dehydrogenase